jgi:hypothetical protein
LKFKKNTWFDGICESPRIGNKIAVMNKVSFIE